MTSILIPCFICFFNWTAKKNRIHASCVCITSTKMGAIEIITLFMEVIFNANGFILNSIIVSFRISLYSIFLIMLSKVLFLTEKCQENSHSFQSAVIICLFNLQLITDFSLLYCWLLKDKDHIIKVIHFQRHACDWIKSVNNNNHNSERNFCSQSNSRSFSTLYKLL